MCDKFVRYEKKIPNELGYHIEVIHGIDAGNRSVYKLIKYNEFESQLTKIPKGFRKRAITKKAINDWSCGDKFPLKEDKSKLVKYKKDKYYFTHDNGGRPFIVSFLVYLNKKIKINSYLNIKNKN
jgi:hypothetical protein